MFKEVIKDYELSENMFVSDLVLRWKGLGFHGWKDALGVETLEAMVREISTRQLCQEIGRRICNESSILYWAAKKELVTL